MAGADSGVTRHVAIAGNPNCGKSTIFNALTGLRQKVGNYPGVTVEKKTGRFFGSHGEPMELLDLPGSYSLQVRSPDEAVARDVLLGRLPGEEAGHLGQALVLEPRRHRQVLEVRGELASHVGAESASHGIVRRHGKSSNGWS